MWFARNKALWHLHEHCLQEIKQIMNGTIIQLWRKNKWLFTNVWTISANTVANSETYDLSNVSKNNFDFPFPNTTGPPKTNPLFYAPRKWIKRQCHLLPTIVTLTNINCIKGKVGSAGHNWRNSCCHYRLMTNINKCYQGNTGYCRFKWSPPTSLFLVQYFMH